MQRRVTVHGKAHWVTVHQYSDWPRKKPTWYAIAEYEGEEIAVKGRSEADALEKWIRAAEVKRSA
jgi:hypothetical protein